MGLYRRKDSSIWWMSFCHGNKQYKRSTGTEDKKTAEKIYNTIKAKIILGRWIPENEQERKDYLFNDLVEKYLPFSLGRHKSEARQYSIKKLNRIFGKFKLDNITIEVVEKFQSALLSEGLQAGGINRQVSLLKAMMAKACDWNMISESHLKEIRKVKPLKGEKTRLRYLSVEECGRLISECPERLRPVVIFALNTGMRRGEILNLRWKDVDMKNKIILLPNISTKTMQKREIPLNETAYRLLASMVRPLNDDEKIFKLQVRIREDFERACKKANIHDFRFHDLRHTFASHLVMSGVDIQTVSKLLGHTTLTMTLRYAHLSHSHLAQGIKVLDKIFAEENNRGTYPDFRTVNQQNLTNYRKIL